MKVPWIIILRRKTKNRIGEDVERTTNYYYFETYETKEQTMKNARELKERYKEEARIKWHIIETKDSPFLPTTNFHLYLNKKLRIL